MNRQISNKTPQTYFPDIIKKVGHEPFAAQCIPMDEKVLNLEAYRTFLVKRRNQVAVRLNEFLQGAR